MYGALVYLDPVIMILLFASEHRLAWCERVRRRALCRPYVRPRTDGCEAGGLFWRFVANQEASVTPSDLMMHDRCDRCSRFMSARIVSYFEDKMICMECVTGERRVLTALNAKQVEVSNLAGCGYLPDDDRFRRRAPHQRHLPERRKASPLVSTSAR